jgi:REP element-mobilizing transposase RayT
MNLTPFKSLTWAYQLHYYLCFRTHRRHQSFLSKESLLKEFITEICERHQYHLLEMNNGQHLVGKNYPQVLIEAGINQLWQRSAYAGTCGEYTSGLIQKWLNSSE